MGNFVMLPKLLVRIKILKIKKKEKDLGCGYRPYTPALVLPRSCWSPFTNCDKMNNPVSMDRTHSSNHEIQDLYFVLNSQMPWREDWGERPAHTDSKHAAGLAS